MSVRIEHLDLKYWTPQGWRRVLDLPDVDFPAGRISAIIGASGCGKTSLLRAMAGFFHDPDGGTRNVCRFEGDISVHGRAISGLRRETALIFQDYGLLPWKTVFQNVELPLRLRQVPRQLRQQTTRAFLAELDLDRHARYFPEQLSGGLKQRVALARAFANGPDLLLMDEPFSALDALTRERAQETLCRLWQRHRMTTILVTHSIEEAICLGDLVYVMHGNGPGRISLVHQVERPAPVGTMSGTSAAWREFRSSQEFFRQVVLIRAALENPS